MRRILTGILAVAFAASSATVLKADSIFNFEDVPLDTTTTFTETNNGVTATFSSSVPGAFLVDINPDGIGSGQRLIQDDQTAINNPQLVSLTISFGGQLFQSVNFPFAILNTVEAGSQLTLQALLGGSTVGSVTAGTTTNLSNNPPYSGGALNYSPGSTFDTLVLSSNYPGFAIDNLSVSTSAVSGVPEPAPIALLMFGTAGILGFIRHRQQRRAALRASNF